VEGRLGRIFEGELDRFCLRLAEKVGDDGQAEIDPRGDSARGDQVAVTHYAALHGDGAEFRQEIVREPVRGRAATLQKSRSPQDERAGADRGHVAHPRGLGPDEVEDRGILQRALTPPPPGMPRTSRAGHSPKVMVGASTSPVADAIAEGSFQIRCTFAPGSEAKTS
jgi:hypothetical protein